MKAISMWQPWAGLVSAGWKHYETRSFDTKYRGTLLIHAAKTQKGWELIKPNLKPAIMKIGITKDYGKLLCKVDLVRTFKTEDIINKLSSCEIQFGDYSPGRYAWQFTNLVKFKPIPYRGQQGFFNVDDVCIKIA